MCTCCGQKKLATEFNKHKWRKDGLSTQCKQCDSIQQAKYVEKYKNNKTPKTKICNKCHTEKPASEFIFSSRSYDKLSVYCKNCNRVYTKQRQKHIEQYKIDLPENYIKVCNICKIAKPASDFYKSSYNVDGLQYTCKECEKREERKIYNLKYSRQIIIKRCKICGAEFKAARSGLDRCESCR